MAASHAFLQCSLHTRLGIQSSPCICNDPWGPPQRHSPSDSLQAADVTFSCIHDILNYASSLSNPRSSAAPVQRGLQLHEIRRYARPDKHEFNVSVRLIHSFSPAGSSFASTPLLLAWIAHSLQHLDQLLGQLGCPSHLFSDLYLPHGRTPIPRHHQT